MDYVCLNCKNCGATIQIPPGRQRWVCQNCGSQISVKESYSRSSIDSLVIRATTHLNNGDYNKASKAYEELVEYHPHEYYGWEGRILCATENYTVQVPSENLITWMTRIRETAPADIFTGIKNQYIEYAKRITTTHVNKLIQKAQGFRTGYEIRIDNSTRQLESVEKWLSEANRKNSKSKAKFRNLIVIVIVAIIVNLLVLSNEVVYGIGMGVITIGLIVVAIRNLPRLHNEIKSSKAQIASYESNKVTLKESLEADRKRLKSVNKYLRLCETRMPNQVLNQLMRFEEGHEDDEELMKLKRKVYKQAKRYLGYF